MYAAQKARYTTPGPFVFGDDNGSSGRMVANSVCAILQEGTVQTPLTSEQSPPHGASAPPLLPGYGSMSGRRRCLLVYRGMNSGDEVPVVEGLGHSFRPAQVLHRVGFPELAAGENDCDVGPVFEYPSAQTDAIQLAWHTNITENQIYGGARFLEDRYSFGRAFRLYDLKTIFFQVQGNAKPDDGLIFDNQN